MKYLNVFRVLFSFILIYVFITLFAEYKLTSFTKFIENVRYALIGEVATSKDQYWAKEILNGGYILHFRHAEREKWIDVQMYDALESDSKENNRVEHGYFAGAVCLSDRGKIQAKAMAEIITAVNLPIDKVVSSVSCRARQTSVIAFGGHEFTDRILVHRGPYNENAKTHAVGLKSFYSNLLVPPHHPRAKKM